MSSFENWSWDYKRGLQYLVSMRIFAFSVIFVILGENTFTHFLYRLLKNQK